MRVVESSAEMRSLSSDLKRHSKTIGFVPTMGFLHEGHMSLMRRAHAMADVTVVSIFVNPTQFGPNEDLDQYPRDLSGDLERAASCGVEIAYVPDVEAMYPEGFQTYVSVTDLSLPLCGASRPGHFRGVATVVAKLFNVVRPDVAVFGRKDYQQLKVIERMVRDLDMGIQIEAGPIVRETDGLAMSSRNSYLSGDERRQATCLVRGMRQAQSLFEKGERSADRLVATARSVIDVEPDAKVDYVEVRDAETLAALTTVGDRAVMALAVFVGTTRLIDNVLLGVDGPLVAKVDV
ncbi:MAG: pantoate--beta-alanine ligase [Deltaproteobacteria bacterium]|nr:pantoate--beta-alanine ligase [Deltaproteobacteria bacterium]